MSDETPVVKRHRGRPKGAKDKPTSKRGGTSAVAAAQRRKLFVEAYLRNGNNASAAAEAAGLRGDYAKHQGHQLLHEPAVAAAIAARAKQLADAAEMSAETWAHELRALAFSSVGDLVGPDGRFAPIADLPRHVQAAISSVEVDADGRVKYKLWSKTAALETMAKHLGLFEKDNSQRAPDVRVSVVLVG